MKAFSTRALAASMGIMSATFLSGCAPVSLTLVPEEAGQGGSGLVRQNFVQPHQIEVTLDGQLYTGAWRTQAAPDHPLAQSYDNKHTVGRVITTLTNANGNHLYCNWLVDGLHGFGTCEAESHRKFDVTIG